MLSLITQLFDLAGRVHSLERRQVDHAEDHFQALQFGLRLNAARLETFCAFDHADLIDRR